MNYIILNGKNSNLIKGLLIQSLPFISKPLVRTQIEEIDGRDGDIITKLGYSAYDKEFSIGLYGDYDIDEVIQFFDSEGKVIFSNEPDKYYRYQMIDQIDFEKLIRFKTATVTMHVQPFKFSAVDKPVGLVNLFSIPDFSLTKNGITLEAENGSVSISGTATKDTEFYVPIDLTLDAGSYGLQATATGSGCSACFMSMIDGVPIHSKMLGGNSLRLRSNKTSVLNGNLAVKESFNNLWFYIVQGTAISADVAVKLVSKQIYIKNLGNIYSKPNLTIIGSGNIDLYLNGTRIFIINIPVGADYITINVEEMQAYAGTVLMNRYVSGDYADLILNKGLNVISWSGNVTQIFVDKYSRWI